MRATAATPTAATAQGRILRGFARFSVRIDGSARRRLWMKLSKLLQSNVPLLKALDSLRDRRIQNAGTSDPLAMALTEWRSIVNNGRPLSDAVADWVSDDERMLILAGEQSGTLKETLLSVTTIMEAKKKITSALAGLAYPAFLFVLVIGFVWMFGAKIVPQFSGMMDQRGAQWKGTAKVIVEMSGFVQNWMWLVAVVIVAGIVAMFISLPRWNGPVRSRLDKSIPPWSLYRLITGTSWIISLAALVESGMRIESALQQLAARANPWLRLRIDACMSGMHAGYNLGDALAKSGYSFPDRELIDDLGLYADLGSFGDALANLGRDWLVDAVEIIKGRVSILVVLGVLFAGATIGVVVSGVMGMQSQMASVMQQRQ